MPTLVESRPALIGEAPAPSISQPRSTAQPHHSARFDVMRVSACLAVILLHLSATIVMERELLGTMDWHVANLIDAATRWCVPVFVMLSGALLLHPRKHASPQHFWARRSSRLLPALIAWSALYLAWRALFWKEPLSAAIVLHDLIAGRPYIHLYFLFLIAGLYLVTPFLARAIEVLPLAQLRQVILIMGGLALAANLFDFLASSAFTMFVPYLAYYLGGWYCARALANPSSHAQGLAVGGAIAVITGLTALLVTTRGFEDRWAFYFYEDFSPTVIVMAIGIFLLILHGPIPQKVEALAQYVAPWTLGVYIAHPIVVELLRYGYDQAMPILLRPPYYVPVTFVATVLLTSGAIAAMQQVPGLRRIV